MFNSALIYELAVLKPYVEAQLFGIERECPEYLEAKRLLKFLDYFVGIGSENVPANSLLKGVYRWRMFPCDFWDLIQEGMTGPAKKGSRSWSGSVGY